MLDCFDACPLDPNKASWEGACGCGVTDWDADGDGVADCNEINGCTDAIACNWNPLATDDDGSCAYAELGYACDGGCLLDSDDDGVCDQNEVNGCQDAQACNFNPTATDEGICLYPDEGYNCEGGCLSDADLDGVCDAFEIEGCTQMDAANYDSFATENDGSCIYLVFGCTYQIAVNYNADATSDDGSCEFADESGLCPSDVNQDGAVGVADLLIVLSAFGSNCPE